MADKKQTIVVAPMHNDTLISPGDINQPFSVMVNLPHSDELAKMLKDVYGPIISEIGDYRPLAAYIRTLVFSSVQQAMGHVQARLSQAENRIAEEEVDDNL